MTVSSSESHQSHVFFRLSERTSSFTSSIIQQRASADAAVGSQTHSENQEALVVLFLPVEDQHKLLMTQRPSSYKVPLLIGKYGAGQSSSGSDRYSVILAGLFFKVSTGWSSLDVDHSSSTHVYIPDSSSPREYVYVFVPSCMCLSSGACEPGVIPGV